MNDLEARLQPGRLAALLTWWARRHGGTDEQSSCDMGWHSHAENVQYKIIRFRLRLVARKRKMRQLDRLMDDLRSARLINRCVAGLAADQSGAGTGAVSFKHSGNAGDLIYALPAMRALCQGRPAKLFLKIGAPVNAWTDQQHPLGKIGLSIEMATKLKPLLAYQPWLSDMQIHAGEKVDYDFDLFRNIPNFKVERGDIARWYFWQFGVAANLSDPWLELGPPPAPGGRIVLARSTRYRNPNISYAFLRDLGEMDFVGTRAEFDEMRQVVPQLRYTECDDFLQLARIIKSARFFIGNQSFPFALAEALKVPRILEVFPEYPNVAANGAAAAEAFFQPGFERLVKNFCEQNSPADAGTEPSTPGH